MSKYRIKETKKSGLYTKFVIQKRISLFSWEDLDTFYDFLAAKKHLKDLNQYFKELNQPEIIRYYYE